MSATDETHAAENALDLCNGMAHEGNTANRARNPIEACGSSSVKDSRQKSSES